MNKKIRKNKICSTYKIIHYYKRIKKKKKKRYYCNSYKRILRSLAYFFSW